VLEPIGLCNILVGTTDIGGTRRRSGSLAGAFIVSPMGTALRLRARLTGWATCAVNVLGDGNVGEGTGANSDATGALGGALLGGRRRTPAHCHVVGPLEWFGGVESALGKESAQHGGAKSFESSRNRRVKKCHDLELSAQWPFSNL
jgi:hypothetical protein